MAEETKQENKFLNIAISITLAAVLGLFNFVWNMNGTIARMEERDKQRTEAESERKGDIKTMKSDISLLQQDVQQIKNITSEPLYKRAQDNLDRTSQYKRSK